jgi:prephenate dehydrogenase
MFKEITIIGVGFMGASLAGALKSLKPDIVINGLDVDQKNIDFCLKNNFIDRAILLNSGGHCGNTERSVSDIGTLYVDITDINFNSSKINKMSSAYNPKQSDITILCIPPKIILKFLSVYKNFLSQFQLITDIGSIKKEIVSAAKKIGLNNFIGSHPMCGSDKSGAENADIGMFHGKTCIVIEEAGVFEKTALFWKTLGMEIVYADACFHDYMVGYSSHLPHVVSFCLSKTVLDATDANQSLNSLKYIASGFKDTTRIAASSENIWTDIFLLNADNLISSLDNYIDNLSKFKVFLENNDENALNKLIAEISKQRKMLN